ncbi:MAG TPA: DUF898 family protein [Vampirovibrionales bacterium]
MQELIRNKNSFTFHGSGFELFKIFITNLILIILTLGIYYPWAKVALLRYTFKETEFARGRFTFHGEGKEIFFGWLKAIAIFIALYSLSIIGELTHNDALLIVGSLILVFGIPFLLPIIINSFLRYRLSRTSWKGIHLGYRGNVKKLFGIYVKGLILSVITSGIYSAWFIVDLRKYVLSNIRFGNLQFSYKANGFDLFKLTIKGLFLSIITLGVYLPSYLRQVFDFFVTNIFVIQDGKKIQLESRMTGWQIFVLFVKTRLALILTLGLATPWVTIWELENIFRNIVIPEELQADEIRQTEQLEGNALGDEVADFLDIELDLL